MRKQHKKMPLEKGAAMRQRRQREVHSTPDSRIEKENSPSLSHIPKRSLDFILYYLTLQLIKKSKEPSSSSSSSSFSQQRHHFFLFQYYKNFQLKNRLKSSDFRCLKLNKS